MFKYYFVIKQKNFDNVIGCLRIGLEPLEAEYWRVGPGNIVKRTNARHEWSKRPEVDLHLHIRLDYCVVA